MFTKKQSGGFESEPAASQDARPYEAASTKPPPATAKPEAPFAGINGEGVILIGKGTRLIGEISECTLVEVQGVIEGKLMAQTVVIREGGGFKGSLQADRAEIHGVMEGSAVINDLLDIRSTGTVAADLAYGRLSVEAGGQMTGNILARVSIETGGHTGTQIAEIGPNGRSPYGGRE